MRLVLLLLLLLLTTSQVLSLTCYVCPDPNDGVCVKEVQCPQNAKYCVTVEQDGNITSRTCSPTCPGGPYTSCCDEDLC